MSIDQCAAAIREYMQTHDWVSFIEIQNYFGDKLEVRGGHAIDAPEPFGNVIVWCGMSETLSAALLKELNSKHLFMHSCAYLVYLIDGGTPNLPVAKRACTYKELHWLPVCLRRVPHTSRRLKKPAAAV